MEITRANGGEITQGETYTNAAAAYLATLRGGSRRTMAQALNTVAQWAGYADAFAFPWEQLRYEHVQAVRAWLVDSGRKPATVNKYLAAIRGALRAAWLMGRMDGAEYQRAAAVKGVRNSTLPAGRELTAGEIAALMAACQADPGPAGVRDAAILAVMYAGGLRRSEVAGLQMADVDAEAGRLIIHGKGGKSRTVYLAAGARDALADWLAIRGGEPGPVFVRINKGGRVLPSGMTAQAIYDVLRRRAEAAGVAAFSPHDLRRTFASHMLAAGADVVLVAKLMGHASTDTTARYDRRPEQAKQEAAGRLHVPYRRRR